MIVVDTNILVYAALPGSRSEVRETLFRHDPQWAAPLLWRSEFRNVIAGCLRRRQLVRSQASLAISLAAEFLTGGEHLVEDARVLDLVEQSRCTSYDCEFVALARELGIMLVTEDRDLLRDFPRDCRSVTDLTR